MMLRRCMAALIFLEMLWGTPLYALSPVGPSIHTERLWRLAELEERTLEQSGVVLHDATMERGLRTVVLRLWEQVATDLTAPVIEVVMATRTDAYTYPNGVILLTTGMLEQIENQDQLAIILAHELIHYARQHTIQLYDHLQVSAQTNGLLSVDHNQTISETDVEQQVRAAEDQADSEGLAIFKAAGYCEAEVLPLISTMIDHMKAHGASKALDDMVARKIRMQAMISQDPMAGTCPSTADADREFFLDCIAPALMANVQTAIRHGEWGLADRCVARYITMKSDDAQAYYLQGEIMRRRDDVDHEEESKACYEAALKIDPQFPPVHRALGELHFKAGQYQQAKPYFETFLSLAPEDEFRAYVEGYLRQCQD
jgi:predicted Zn-dependent protease